MSIKIDGVNIEVSTPKLRAKFVGPTLVSLCDASGRTFIRHNEKSGPAALEIVLLNKEVQPLEDERAELEIVRVSENAVNVHLKDPDADAIIRISTDKLGRLVVEPSVQTIPRGLAAVRWNIWGIAKDFQLVAPLFQGCRLELEEPLLANDEYEWPTEWEAALAILQSDNGGWSICANDEQLRPKRFITGHERDIRTLGFQTEAFGPWDRNSAVGSLAWIIDTHSGGWEEAAGVYRDWMREIYNYDYLKTLRPEWVGDIRFTMQWCPCDKELIELLVKMTKPQQTLIHVPIWRSDPYDHNYPEYTPCEEGKAFISYLLEKGFKVIPHFNYFAMDPNHPLFPRMSEFVMKMFVIESSRVGVGVTGRFHLSRRAIP